MRIIVTGGSGKLGSESIRQLLAAGHEVMTLDPAPPQENLRRFTRIDFTDFGEVVEAMSHIDGGWTGVDAVVHFAAIPGPSHAANARTFANLGRALGLRDLLQDILANDDQEASALVVQTGQAQSAPTLPRAGPEHPKPLERCGRILEDSAHQWRHRGS